MTTSATSTFELNRDQLIRRAFQLARVLYSGAQTDPDDLSMAVDILGAELDSLQADGVILRTVERATQTLSASTASYTLDSDVLDVFVGPDNVAGMVYASGEAGTTVHAISRHEYTSIPDQTIEGTPTMVYVERLAATKLLFYPVPSETLTFRYQEIRLMRDMDTGSRTLDLGKRWQKAILYGIAWQLAAAKSIDLNYVGFLKGVAEDERARARLSESESMHGQFYIQRYY